MALLKLTAGAMFVAGLIAPATSYAQNAAGFGGTWKQIHSSAGDCSNCSIKIVSNDGTFLITSSNGWAATALADAPDHLNGTGNWDGTDQLSGPFKIAIKKNQEELILRITFNRFGGTFVARFSR